MPAFSAQLDFPDSFRAFLSSIMKRMTIELINAENIAIPRIIAHSDITSLTMTNIESKSAMARLKSRVFL